MHIDHIDGDKLNNRIENLRICTHNQNQHNQGIRASNKSGYKGVSWMKSVKKWQAQICCNSKVTHLGLYTNKIEAAKAYDEAAKKLHGDFAWLNFPEKSAPDTRKTLKLKNKPSREFGVTAR
nr:HNH endonuclease [Proteus terrae]